jgi:hypothetical protein
MVSTNYRLTRYDADEGKYFEWKEPRYTTDENGNEIRELLKAKTLFLGHTDSISNYVEVDEEGNETELEESEVATEEDYKEALSQLGVE